MEAENEQNRVFEPVLPQGMVFQLIENRNNSQGPSKLSLGVDTQAIRMKHPDKYRIRKKKFISSLLGKEDSSTSANRSFGRDKQLSVETSSNEDKPANQQDRKKRPGFTLSRQANRTSKKSSYIMLQNNFSAKPEKMKDAGKSGRGQKKLNFAKIASKSKFNLRRNRAENINLQILPNGDSKEERSIDDLIERGSEGRSKPTRVRNNFVNTDNFDQQKRTFKFLLEIRALSSWGQTRIAGLTGVEIIDNDGNAIKINHSQVEVLNGGINATKTLERLFNQTNRSTDEENMWKFVMPDHPEFTTIRIRFETQNLLLAIRIWNFNKKGGEDAGIKDAQIVINGRQIFNGSIAKGSGDETDESCTSIYLTKNVPSEMRSGKHNYFSEPGDLYSNDYSNIRMFKAFSRTQKVLVKHIGPGFERPSVEQSAQPIIDLKIERKANSQKSINSQQAYGGIVTPRSSLLERDPSTSKKSIGSNEGGVRRHPKIAHSLARKFIDESMMRGAGSCKQFEKRNLINPILTHHNYDLSESEKRSVGRFSSTDTNKTGGGAVHMTSANTNKKFLMVINENPNFLLPELPEGRVLKINIFSNWGDSSHIGLNSIELFDSFGSRININDPRDALWIESKSGKRKYSIHHDPEYLIRILDLDVYTTDAEKMWIKDFSAGDSFSICMSLPFSVKLSMIRFWNYSRSRTHSGRGIRHLSIELDHNLIFIGEISKSPGGLPIFEDSETILFTSDLDILGIIADNDHLLKARIPSSLQRGAAGSVEKQNSISHQKEKLVMNMNDAVAIAGVKYEDYFTEHKPNIMLPKKTLVRKEPTFFSTEKATLVRDFDSLNSKTETLMCDTFEKEIPFKQTSTIEIAILSSYNNDNICGIAAIELLDSSMKKIKIGKDNVFPMDEIETVSGQPYYLLSGDPLKKTLNYMWLFKFEPGKTILKIQLGKSKEIGFLRVYNYREDRMTSYGVSSILLKFDDGTTLSNLIIKFKEKSVSIATESCLEKYSTLLNMKEEIPEASLDPFEEELSRKRTVTDSQIQKFIPPEISEGMCMKIKMLSTWGDSSIIGLDQIELYGPQYKVISNQEFYIIADPSLVIESSKTIKNDPNNLFIPKSEKMGFDKGWISSYIYPKENRNKHFKDKECNQFVIYFHKPTILKAVNFWNYSKSPECGTRDIEIYIDERIVFKGQIEKSRKEIPTTFFLSRLRSLSDFTQTNVEYGESSTETTQKILYTKSKEFHAPKKLFLNAY